MLGLKKRKHRKILYDKLIDSLGGQISDPWERKMFRRMVENTRLKSVNGIKSGKGWKTEGQNVNRVVVGPRGSSYIGPVDIYVPGKTLEKLKGLQSRRKAEREAGEEALHTVAHEFAHDYFKAINYEARMTRYLRDNPKETRDMVERFLAKGGKVADPRKKAREMVKKNPLFWAGQVAHAAHEGGADLMGTNAAVKIAEGRKANRRDLERFTEFRPFTVKEYLKLKAGRGVKAEKPRKPTTLERLKKNIEYRGAEFINKVGRFDTAMHPSKAREHMARLRAMRGMHEKPKRRHR